MPSYETSMRNLAKANAKWRPPRPWRSDQESRMIRRLIFQWLTCRDRSRPSGRAWARAMGVSHTWLQKVASRSATDPEEMWKLQARHGDPSFALLEAARRRSEEMRANGLLRGRRLRRRY
jgi:hypothetical protein